MQYLLINVRQKNRFFGGGGGGGDRAHRWRSDCC